MVGLYDKKEIYNYISCLVFLLLYAFALSVVLAVIN